ncbi:MAG: hypothetical protein PHZ00_01880 [Candidatus Peribacteraceae bacterium]|nr:hypothetical protein [Candidatus Peribacteraceae bacterium]
MQRTCANPWCNSSFEISSADLDLLEKVSPVIAGIRFDLPAPTLCPDCRQLRRLSYRNERRFYRRPCALTGKECVSLYSKDKPCIVFDQKAWWSDDWNQLATGRSFDPKKSFFAQFHELSLVAPRPCIVNMSSENSLYTNHSAYNKNCYMCINTGYSEDCFYTSDFALRNKNCADCLAIQKCERCYGCVDTKQASFSLFLHECINCTDCAFCYDCQSCKDCIGCWNLRQKQYCIHNEQLTQEAYEATKENLWPKTWDAIEEIDQSFRTLVKKKAIHRHVIMEHCEQTTGDHDFHCKDVRDSYYTCESEECAYCYDTGTVKSCIDANEPYQGELQYESHGCNLGYSLCVCSKCYECSNLLYSQYCWYCKDCFGCFGLRNKRYCILNNQCTKDEYEALVPMIIEHMRNTGDWGQFFPTNLSVFGYNETAAQDYAPITEKETATREWKWHSVPEDKPAVVKVIPAHDLPETIDNVSNEIINWAIECEATKKPFRIIKQELDFYRNMKLPIPRLHPDERHKRRMALRNPRKLWERECGKCGKKIASTYAPERPEIVYCEECYLAHVY